MSRISMMIGAAAIGLAVACGAGGGAQPDAGTTTDDPGATVATHGATDVKWARDWDEAFERARSEEKAVLASFEADWCVWCRRLETTTYRDAKVTSLLGAQVVPVALDVDRDGRELSDTYGVDGLPTVVVFDTDGDELGRIDGYMPPDSFLERLESILAGRG